MYAIIETGGKQYAVSPGDYVRVEKLAGSVGDAIELSNVIAVSGEDGALRTGSDAQATVTATIADHGRRAKINVFKFKRRKMYRRRIGHRQDFTQLRIDSIQQ